MMARISGQTFEINDSMFALVPHTDLLRISDGHVRAVDLIPMPVNEYGIPDRREFFRTVLGSVAADFTWSGYIDKHHLAYTRRDFEAARSSDGRSVGTAFRNCSSVEVMMPRQMHDYSHLVIDKPQVPDMDIMRQWAQEQHEVNRLYDTIKHRQIPAEFMDMHVRDRYRSYQRKISVMQPGELGLLPDLELLSNMSIHEAREALRGLAVVQGYPPDYAEFRQSLDLAA